MPPSRTWYVDSSVALRILLGHSQTAIDWFDEQAGTGAAFVSSRVLELEMVRVLRREALDPRLATDFTSELTLLRLDDALVREAGAIRPHIKSLDALHLASALRLGPGEVTIVTHDGTMTRVAESLGFDVLDPVT
ncbi:MAG: type II toxin-antitoxin system VapC family toxin [Micrococcales bacterium]|nr:type II toxin-antitoxin system VapC family toxin [Micrococcales bacterium]